MDNDANSFHDLRATLQKQGYKSFNKPYPSVITEPFVVLKYRVYQNQEEFTSYLDNIKILIDKFIGVIQSYRVEYYFVYDNYLACKDILVYILFNHKENDIKNFSDENILFCEY